MHARGGFDLVLLSVAGIAAVLFVSVQAFVVLAVSLERGRQNAVQPAE